jgi:hypothetical protein
MALDEKKKEVFWEFIDRKMGLISRVGRGNLGIRRHSCRIVHLRKVFRNHLNFFLLIKASTAKR